MSDEAAAKDEEQPIEPAPPALGVNVSETTETTDQAG